MNRAHDLLKQAYDQHRAGHLDFAEELYREVLFLEPNNSHAWHLSGVLAHQRGQKSQAANSIERAIAIDPSIADFHDNLASVYQALGQSAEAIRSAREAAQLAPENYNLLNKLAVLLATTSEGEEEAVTLFRRIVDAHPESPVSHVNLGNTLVRLGRVEEAVNSFRTALALPNSPPQALNSLITALGQLGRLDEAEASCRSALESRPESAEAWFALGQLLEARGRLDEARLAYASAVERRPEFARGHYRLGSMWHALGQPAQAQQELATSIRLEPTLAEAHAELADLAREQGLLDSALVEYHEALRLDPRLTRAQINLALTLRGLRRYDEAADYCRQALAIDPLSAFAHSNLGLILQDLERVDEAIASQREAVRLRPDLADLHNALGTVLAHAGRYDEALGELRTSVELGTANTAPAENLAVIHNNLGGVLKQLGRYDEALASFEEGLRQDTRAAEGLGEPAEITPPSYATSPAIARRRPERASLRHNRGLTRLLLGDLAAGWPDFEWRWHVGQTVPRPPLPEWDGSPLAGRTILLYPEQGIGDTIQFIRYASLVKQRGGTVVLACPARLAELLGTCPGIDRVISEHTRLKGIDVQAALVSLPRLLGTDLGSIPAEVPYLSADAALVEHWRERLQSADGFRVGVAWQGNPAHAADPRRSIPLAAFAPLATSGVRLISLQKGYGIEQLAHASFVVEDLGSRLDEAGSAFRDTAAVIKNLDLVIVSDSAICHLAGALAAPVWVALPFSPDWRWLLERSDSPWYPTMRLFRQQMPGDWAETFGRIAAELAKLLAAPAGDSTHG